MGILKNLKMRLGIKSWQEKLIEDIDKEELKAGQRALSGYMDMLEKIRKTSELKKRMVGVLREKPLWFFGDTAVYIKTNNNLLAHDIVKELRIRLERVAGGDGFNYNGSYDGVNICVYGVEAVAGCRVVKKKVMKEVTEFEVVCNGS